MLGEGLAGVGRGDPASGADEEIGSERPLELADLFGDGGLRDPQLVGRGGEGPELRGGAEAPQLLQCHKLSF